MDNYRLRTVNALGWAFTSQIASQIISFIFGIILARLLVPDDFGLIAMIMVFVALARLLSDIGLGASLIHKKNIQEEHYSTVFWMNLALGLTMSAILFMSSSWLAIFYDRAEIGDIAKLLSASFIIGALSSVPRTRLIKDLKYKQQSIADFFALIVSGAIAISLAANGYSYWALVIHILLRQAISTILIWAIVRWVPKSKFKFAALYELFGFSAAIFSTNLLRYAANNLDKLLLGKFMGGESLGIYDKAHSTMLFPLQNVSRVVGGVMFPSLSLIQEDKRRVKNVYLRTVRSIAFITFPMMVGMFVVAESFTLGVLGEHWMGLIPILKVFCVAGIVTSISTITGSLFQSQGAAALEFKMTIVTVAIRMVGIIVGLKWGAIGVAVGFTISMYINAAIGFVVAGRLVDLSIYDVINKTAPTLLPTIIMAFIVWGVQLLADINNDLLLFLIQVFMGVISYVSCVVILKQEAYDDIVNILSENIKRKK